MNRTKVVEVPTPEDTFLYHIKRGFIIVHIAQFGSFLVQTFLYAYVIAFIPQNRGLSARLISICSLAAASLAYSLLYIRLHLEGHPPIVLLRRVFRDTDGLILFPMVVSQIVVMRDSRLPYNCYGLTRQNWNPHDLPNDPAPGYATIRFGDGTPDGTGELDYLCPEAQVGFVLELFSLILLFVGFILTGLYLKHEGSNQIAQPKFLIKTLDEFGVVGEGSPSSLEFAPGQSQAEMPARPPPDYPASPTSSVKSQAVESKRGQRGETR